MLNDTSVLNKTKGELRILVISVRGFRAQVANCSLYEFEDVLCELESARLYTPTHEFEMPRKVYRMTKYATGSADIARSIAPFPAEITLEEDYDLLFAVFDNPWQMHLMESIKNWREKCRHKACYIMETWKPSFDDWRLVHEPFQNFDYIFSGIAHCVDSFSEVTGLPCKYLAPAINALKFCPYPNPAERLVDVCCVGRRPAGAHQSLFDRSQQDDNFFYYYDTVNNKNLEVSNPRQHRAKLVNLLQRSRYNIAAHAKFDSMEETGGFHEIGTRYFEGVAAGTVLIGMPPMGDVFPQYFDWEDAIIKVNLYKQDVLEVIDALNAQPERVEAIRRRNIVNALLKHDWVYRWREVLEALNLEPSQAVLNREKQLQRLACSVDPVDLPIAC
ncbi:glycosyltransferase [Leptothoe kymatousa]|uniref:Glycosyltransferase family 1 protein n=1 Tax=Leptothoe kymatousa TAU-MAC 1615 TaxID=2364775 RepID=A0ABS5XZ47_9CYAN|nr:glycosyltransferase [Leptothoe kymatousa]MBT9310882.1 glycosyltransferase family 1 protein [Leptothoe kymatousa TAU-MAC 1615]